MIKEPIKKGRQPGVVEHTCNTTPWEVEAGGSQV
jgi:hypothetical protein